MWHKSIDGCISGHLACLSNSLMVLRELLNKQKSDILFSQQFGTIITQLRMGLVGAQVKVSSMSTKRFGKLRALSSCGRSWSKALVEDFFFSFSRFVRLRFLLCLRMESEVNENCFSQKRRLCSWPRSENVCSQQRTGSAQFVRPVLIRIGECFVTGLQCAVPVRFVDSTRFCLLMRM